MKVTAAELNRRFGEVRDRAREGTVTITHHGKPTLVLTSVERCAAFMATPVYDEALIYGQLTLIVDNLDEGFMSIGRDWTIKCVNRITELFVSRRRAELIGKSFLQMFADSSDGIDQVRRTMDTGVIITCERFSEMRPDRYIAVTTFPMPAPYDGIGAFFSNRTESERLRRNQREDRAALDALFDHPGGQILIMLDRDGTIERWSAGAAALLGWTPEDVVGKPLVALLASGKRLFDNPLQFMTKSGAALDASVETIPLGEAGRSLRILRPIG